ncbi:MAG: hypothetical protein ACR2LU_11925, partial [Luteitalea sp.]
MTITARHPAAVGAALLLLATVASGCGRSPERPGSDRTGTERVGPPAPRGSRVHVSNETAGTVVVLDPA